MENRGSLRGSSLLETILILTCVGLLVFLAVPILNSLSASGFFPYGSARDEGNFPEPQTTIVFSVLGLMTVMAIVGGYVINSDSDGPQGWWFTGILILAMWVIGIALINLI